jgi:hypothetical protein
MTYLQAAHDALACQDACNASGVVHSFDQAMSALWDEAHKQGKGTEWVNRHPIVTLFIDKLASLNRTQCLCSGSMDAVHKATTEVENIIVATPAPAIASR